MKYMFMIWEDENDPVSNAPEVGPAYAILADEWRSTGKYAGGDALHPAAQGATVRVRNGQRLVTDGPFTETKEILAGTMILECKDMAEALDCAVRMPTASFGAIEVRALRSRRTS